MRSGEEAEGLHGEGSHTAMVSGATSPYQPTTEPVYPGGVFGNISCNTHYLTSQPGILKILQVVDLKYSSWEITVWKFKEFLVLKLNHGTMVLSLIGFICIETVMMCSPCAGVYLFEFVSCSAFIFTGGLLLVFSLNLHTKVHQVNWRLTDLINAVCSTLLFFIASVVLATLNHQSGAEIASVIFGFVVTVVYGVNMYVCIRQWRTGDPDPLQTSEYTRARTASRGEVETRPE